MYQSGKGSETKVCYFPPNVFSIAVFIKKREKAVNKYELSLLCLLCYVYGDYNIWGMNDSFIKELSYVGLQKFYPLTSPDTKSWSMTDQVSSI